MHPSSATFESHRIAGDRASIANSTNIDQAVGNLSSVCPGEWLSSTTLEPPAIAESAEN